MCKISECKHFTFSKWEYSKKLLYATWILIWVLLPICVTASIVVADISPLREYVIGAFSLASISHGFYYWKAKNENLHKYGRDQEIKHD